MSAHASLAGELRSVWLRSRLFTIWALLAAVSVAAVSAVEQRRLFAELETESAILHRLASQRADQHDAHLTSLSAVAVAGGEERFDLFLDVAATIKRFYPRIRAVDLIPLTDGIEGASTRAGPPGGLRDIVRAAARASRRNLEIRTAAANSGTYLLIKRSPNTDAARYALTLEVDAAALIASDAAFWSRPTVTRSIRMPDGTVLVGGETGAVPDFSKPLGSASQPLILETSIAPGLAGLFPPGRIAAILGLITALYLATLLALRQVARTRTAERQMRLSAQEARLAHASRVNSLGEMASGMAHELTQPLTAILSQVQAGRRLLERGDTGALRDVLDDTVAQARRAAAILDRLRRWSRPNRNVASASSLNDAARSVEALLGPEAVRIEAGLHLDLSDGALPVKADPVELEQVIFNLVRNALDAVGEAPRREVTLTTRQDVGRAVLEVADTGPGVPQALRPRLFEPFVTGRPDGTGLGLALCQRLVERMEGEIALRTDTPGTVFRVSLPLSFETARRAAG